METIRENNSLLLAQIESLVSLGYFTWDVKSAVCKPSHQLLQTVSAKRGQLEGEGQGNSLVFPDVLVDLAAPADREKIRRVLYRSLADAASFSVSFKVETETGAIEFWQLKGKPLVNSSEKYLGLLVVLEDVTKQALQQQERDQMILDLARSNQELEEFAYVASHDLQEPLRKIITFSERLSQQLTAEQGVGNKPEQLGSGNISAQQGLLDRILRNTDHMRQLIDDLLSYSRVSRYQPEAERIPLNEVMEKVRADLEGPLEESSAQLVVGDLPVLNGSFIQIQRLFSNLIGNAIKFRSLDRPLRISVQAQTLTVQMAEQLNIIYQPDPQVLISVEDNGIGFEQEYAQRIFQLFQRLHGKAVYPGSGLGLAICKKIVENHGGSIFAVGEQRRGATFYLCFPLKYEYSKHNGKQQ
jgi:signal transduction histidine kinase